MSAPDTLTLASLRTSEFAPGQLGVLGDPIAHSLSPAMHNAALAALRPTHPALASLQYLRLHITAEELPEALRRLRELTGDPILVRSGPGMVPTDAALQMLAPAAQILQSAEQLFLPARAFDPAQAREVFDVSGAGDTAMAVLALLLATVAEVADQYPAA